MERMTATVVPCGWPHGRTIVNKVRTQVDNASSTRLSPAYARVGSERGLSVRRAGHSTRTLVLRATFGASRRSSNPAGAAVSQGIEGSRLASWIGSRSEYSEVDTDNYSAGERHEGVAPHSITTTQTSRSQPEELGVPLGRLANAPYKHRRSQKPHDCANHEADGVVHVPKHCRSFRSGRRGRHSN